MEYMELEWPLIVFTFFICLAGGVFALQAYQALRGQGKSTQMASLLVAAAAFVIGGIGSFLHLQHWQRMLNGFGHLSSPITHEFIAVALFALVLVLYFLLLRRSESGRPPQWFCVLAIVVGLALPVLCGHSYMMVADPVWNTPLILLFYLTDAVVLGSFTCLIIAKAQKSAEDLRGLALLALVASAARLLTTLAYALAIYLMAGDYLSLPYYFDPTLPDRPLIDPTVYMHAILAGELSASFYLAVVLLGGLLPLAIAIALTRSGAKPKPDDASASGANSSASGANTLLAASVALACAAAGGVVWRCMLYWVCIKVFPYYFLG